ncbi:MAG: cobalt ABC transporter permease [Methanoculleus sp. SDB]|nr:MAG: cobalt ABC transporter permease [Methanoculleus sp. SDB]
MDNILDDYAHTNGLRDADTRLKLVMGAGAILISVSSGSSAAPLFIAATMALITVGLAKIPVAFYARLLAIPAGFVLTSGIVLIFLTGGGIPLWEFTLPCGTLSVTTAAIDLASVVCARTLGGMCSLYFIALSTPMIEMFSVMRSLHLPREFVDLSMLIYRFIFILIGEAIAIKNAQEMRHGYAHFSTSLQSFSILGAMLFIRSLAKGEDLIRAMDARCYDGKLELLSQTRALSILGILCVTGYLTACVLILLSTTDIMIG